MVNRAPEQLEEICPRKILYFWKISFAELKHRHKWSMRPFGAKPRIKILPRRPADLRISIKRRGGGTYRIELIRQPFGQRFWVRRDGKVFETPPEATASEIAERIRRWIVAACLLQSPFPVVAFQQVLKRVA